MATSKKQKTVVVGAGPVGSLAALYAAKRGDDVELYELRGGGSKFHSRFLCFSFQLFVTTQQRTHLLKAIETV